MPVIEREKLSSAELTELQLELESTTQTARSEDGIFVLASLPLAGIADIPTLKDTSAKARATIIGAWASAVMNSTAEGLVQSLGGKIIERKAIQFGRAQGGSLAGPSSARISLAIHSSLTS